MKKCIVKNIKDGGKYGPIFLPETEMERWISEQVAINAWGKSEREIVEFSESYEEADVLSRRSEAIGEGVVNYVTLQKEYDIKEEDLSEDYAWLLAECMHKRRQEYPSIIEISEALMEKFGENRHEKFEDLHLKRMAVKNKYPKPVKKD